MSSIKSFIERNKHSRLTSGQIPASSGRRFSAAFLDGLILSIMTSFIYFLVNGEFSNNWTGTRSWSFIHALYLTITPVLWSGYIIGKRICGIKVKRLDNGRVTIKNMVLRELIGNYLLASVTFGLSIIISIFMIFIREDKRGIHDFIGGTYVTAE